MELPIFVRTDGPTPRLPPARYVPGNGGFWKQGPIERRVKKPYYHFIWPKDGRNGSKWGRAKDILTGKGPDIHITASADKRDYMYNRQRKARWARHKDFDKDVDNPFAPRTLTSPWSGLAGNRDGRRYDFLTRTYRRPDRLMMTDAVWDEVGAKKGVYYPEFVRNGVGEWWGKTRWWEWDDFAWY